VRLELVSLLVLLAATPCAAGPSGTAPVETSGPPAVLSALVDGKVHVFAAAAAPPTAGRPPQATAVVDPHAALEIERAEARWCAAADGATYVRAACGVRAADGRILPPPSVEPPAESGDPH
jgi:hypothetical protein